MAKIAGKTVRRGTMKLTPINPRKTVRRGTMKLTPINPRKEKKN